MSYHVIWILHTAALAFAFATMLAGLPAARAQLPMRVRDFHAPAGSRS